jgi:predicted esterase YcpF (UPF0227 family)
MAIGHLFTAKKVTELFLKEIVFIHGFPSSIVSYEDQIFTSQFLKELILMVGTHIKFRIAFYPHSDGQT